MSAVCGGGTPHPASVWRWIEYGVFDGVGSTLYLRKLSVTLMQTHTWENVARGRMIPQAAAQQVEKPARGRSVPSPVPVLAQVPPRVGVACVVHGVPAPLF